MASMKGRAMVSYGPGFPLEMKEYTVPDPEPDAVVTKITMSSICGSDVHLFKGEFSGGKAKERQKPVIPGHEFVGTVHKLGSNVSTDSMGNPLKEGDRVVWCYYLPCGRCPSCINEVGSCANRHKHAGVTSDDWPHFKGAFADYYYLSPGQWIYKVPDELPDQSAVFVDCAASTVTYALSKVCLPLGGTVVIQGAGGLGLNATPVAKDMGAAKVIVVDKFPNNLPLARTFGADETICHDDFPTPESRIEKVMALTDGKGVDVVMEVVASDPSVVSEGLKMLALNGTYLSVGLVGPLVRVTIPMYPMIDRSIRLIGSSNYRAWTIPKVMDFIVRNQHKYPFDKIISHQFKLEDLNEAFAQVIDGKVVRAAIVP